MWFWLSSFVSWSSHVILSLNLFRFEFSFFYCHQFLSFCPISTLHFEIYRYCVYIPLQNYKENKTKTRETRQTKKYRREILIDFLHSVRCVRSYQSHYEICSYYHWYASNIQNAAFFTLYLLLEKENLFRISKYFYFCINFIISIGSINSPSPFRQARF